MPELPEVETVKSVLIPIVKNRKIVEIEILRATNVHSDPTTFKNGLIGETFLDVTRIGKFLIFHLTNEKVIISHLRMEGKYYELLENEENTKYSRVVLHLDNNHKLCYDDSRCFGYLKLSSEKEYLKDKEIEKLGPEPWVADIKTMMKQVRKISGPIKTALLSQTLMTGLGNIYVDETLFASGINPLTPANKITEKQWNTIKVEASRILKEAIVAGGSTIKSYHPGKDIDGNFQSRLLVYGKGNTPCPKCGSTLKFTKVNGRGTTYCPECQMIKQKQIKVAIFGRISSGKSTVLKMFGEENIPTLSSDEVVSNLYQQKEVIKTITDHFNLKQKEYIDRDELRTLLASNKKYVKEINSIVHPLVKEEIRKFFKEHENGLLAVEVPLLFESKMEKEFDVIIAVDAPKEKQMELLIARDKQNAQLLREINGKNNFDRHQNKADFIISNDADLNFLRKKVKCIISKLRCRLD